MNRIELIEELEDDWELWEKPEVKFAPRNMPPICGIMPSGLYLNRTAMKMIGEDMRAVVLYTPKRKDGIKKDKIMMWFFKNKDIVAKVRGLTKESAYAVVPHATNGSARISCVRFVKDNNLREKTRQLGKVSFPIIQDPNAKDDDRAKDIYIVELKSGT